MKLVRKLKQDDSAIAQSIMDNFKGEVTDEIHTLLEENNILLPYCLPILLMQPGHHSK